MPDMPDPPASTPKIKWWTNLLYRHTNAKPEKLGMEKLAIVFAVLLFLVQLVLAMFGVQSFWLGVFFEIGIAALLVYSLWVWEGTHGIGISWKIISSIGIVALVMGLFWLPAKNQYRREHPLLPLSVVDPQSNPTVTEMLELYYGTQKLDEANLQIAEPKREEMAIRQTKIFVEPNFSNIFTVTGIVPRNTGSVAIQADSAYLEFEVPIELMAANSSPWRLSGEKEAGWAVRYDFLYPVNTIGAGHPGYIPDFSGSPIPTKAMKVKLVIIYGRGKTSAVFTLAPLAK